MQSHDLLSACRASMLWVQHLYCHHYCGELVASSTAEQEHIVVAGKPQETGSLPADTAAVEGATEFAPFGSAVSEALAAANQAASLGEQALQHSTAALNSGQATSAVAQAAYYSHEAQAQQSSVAMEQQPGPEQLPEAGFGYLLTAPNLPPGMSHQEV